MSKIKHEIQLKPYLKFMGLTKGNQVVSGNLTILLNKYQKFKAGYYIANTYGCPFSYDIVVGSERQCLDMKDKNNNLLFVGHKIKGMRGEQNKPDTFHEILGIVRKVRGGFELFNKCASDFTIDDDGKIKNLMWRAGGNNNIPTIYEEINNVEIIGHEFDDIIQTISKCNIGSIPGIKRMPGIKRTHRIGGNIGHGQS